MPALGGETIKPRCQSRLGRRDRSIDRSAGTWIFKGESWAGVDTGEICELLAVGEVFGGHAFDFDESFNDWSWFAWSRWSSPAASALGFFSMNFHFTRSPSRKGSSSPKWIGTNGSSCAWSVFEDSDSCRTRPSDRVGHSKIHAERGCRHIVISDLEKKQTISPLSALLYAASCNLIVFVMCISALVFRFQFQTHAVDALLT